MKIHYQYLFNEQEFIAVCRRTDYHNALLDTIYSLFTETNGKVSASILQRILICF